MTTSPANIPPAPNLLAMPPTDSVQYQSPDLTVTLVPIANDFGDFTQYQVGPFLGPTLSERFITSFLYDTITPLPGGVVPSNVTQTSVDSLKGGFVPGYEVDSGSAMFEVDGLPGALFVDITIGSGGPPVTVANADIRTTNGQGITIGFDDPMVANGTVTWLPPL